MYITWNKAVRKTYALPCEIRRILLDPLPDQRHIKYELFARDIKLLYIPLGMIYATVLLVNA